jgi:hypothetical protein
VDLWRQLVKLAEPTLFLTLTKAGKTVEQAARALTTFMQALRRGSKGRGRNHVGVRAAYPVEYFAVLERHSDFERNGFHWHLLIKGVDSIPYKEVIRPLWTSATQGQVVEEEAYGDEEPHMLEDVEGVEQGHKVHKQHLRIGWIQRIRNARAIGYVTKYLTKALSVGDKGTREVQKKLVLAVVGDDGFLAKDAQGHLIFREEIITATVVSKAHRIRYSRHFFPEAVSELRARLFAGIDGAEDGKPVAPVEEKPEGAVA